MKCKICNNTFQIRSPHGKHRLYCSIKCNKKAYGDRNRKRLNRENLEKYHRSRINLIFPTFSCLHCGTTFKGTTLGRRVFCSTKCLKNNWMKTHKTYMRKMVKDWRHKNLEKSRAQGRKNAAKRYPKFRESIIHDTQMRNTKRRGVIGSYTLKEWNDLKLKFNFTCPCCKKQEPEIKLTRDHIKPIIQGGTNNLDNIQPYCFSCNASKGGGGTRLSCQGTH